MNIVYKYLVTIYGTTPLTGERYIHAESAQEAIKCVRQFMGYAGGFNYTQRNQNDPSEAVRDNAHVQFDRDGINGCYAQRTILRHGKPALPKAAA